MALTVVTWNLKGSERPDTGVVVRYAREVGADVLLLQEVQRRQARAVAGGLGAASLRWGFKHWPVRTHPEGMAVVGVTLPAAVRTRAVTHPWRIWSWRRRIVMTATVPAAGRSVASSPASHPDAMAGGTAASSPASFPDATAGRTSAPGATPRAHPVLANLHLSTGAASGPRVRELDVALHQLDVALDRLAAPSAGGPGEPGRVGARIVAGDLNERPDGAVVARLLAAGLCDAWVLAHPGRSERDGATNWSGDRAGLPTRRIDYVFADADVPVLAADVPRPEHPLFEQLRALSDHLPLTVSLDL